MKLKHGIEQRRKNKQRNLKSTVHEYSQVLLSVHLTRFLSLNDENKVDRAILITIDALKLSIE